MTLKNYKLGELIEQLDNRNSDNKYNINDVRGISTNKCFIETKANMDGVSLTSYKIVNQNEFAYVADTSRRGDKIAIAFNTESSILISSIYTVFRVTKCNLLLADYLFIYFNRPEFDRFSRFNSWGSARETFNWDDFCDIEIDLPSIEIQQKYVNIYNAMLDNQKCYEKGLEDLKLTCDAFIDQLRRKIKHEKIGDLINLSTDTNEDLHYGIDDVRGISIEKKFIPTKANMEGVSLKSYNLVKPDDFAYVTVTSRNGEKISLAFNDSEDTYICSSSYIVFRIKELSRLYPRYLRILLSRDEFNRYARFNSWGSARETFDWTEMRDVEIPLPELSVQKSISEIFDVYVERKLINEKLKIQLNELCPILIKGSLEEGSNLKEA